MRIHTIAVVGCGGVCDMHLTGYHDHPERVEVVAACDPLQERRGWAHRAHGVPATFATIEELLDYGGFDVAVVCTPSIVREPALRSLVAAGKHVLVEKPMADGYEEAARVTRLCADAGVLLAVNQNFRDHYAFGLARKVIADGAIGAVRGVAHQDLTFRQDRGWRQQSPRHALSVMGVHWFDGFRQLIDRDADRITCQTFSSPAIDCAGETDASVLIEFGPISVTYQQSFSSHVKHTETIVVGEEGTLRFDYGHLTRIGPAGNHEHWTNPHSGTGKPESTFRSLDRLLHAIETATEPSNSGQDNLKTIALLDAAYTSARQHRPINLAGGLLP